MTLLYVLDVLAVAVFVVAFTIGFVLDTAVEFWYSRRQIKTAVGPPLQAEGTDLDLLTPAKRRQLLDGDH
jgi:hypothetical protein